MIENAAWFAFGMIVGVNVGLFVFALLNAADDADDCEAQ